MSVRDPLATPVAEKFSTEKALSNAIGQYKSWYAIVSDGVTGTNRRATGIPDPDF